MKYFIGIVVLVVVLGAGYVAFFNPHQNTNSSSQEESVSQKEDLSTSPEGSFTGSIFDLSKRGGDYKCTIAHDSAVASSKGVVYISGDKIRGDFESETQGITVESHLIADTDVYVWSPLAPVGVKLPRAQIEGNGDAATSAEYADYQQSYTYNCEAWSRDESVFSIPSSITFTEIGS